MSQNIYSIQLLNDLHNHFPELLYNSRRFQTVQDVLAYIQSVANMSPFERGYSQYYDNQPPQVVHRQNTTTVPSHINTIPIPRNTNPSSLVRDTSEFGNIAGTGRNSIPLQEFRWFIPEIARQTTTTVPSHTIPSTPLRIPMTDTSLTDTIVTTLLRSISGDIYGAGRHHFPLEEFLNQRVSVYPTNDEIENASTIIRATPSTQSDICTICQENFEVDQQLRRLTHCNHSFHLDCINTWFTGNVHCPTCRHDIREVEVNQQPSQNNPPPVPENHRRTNIHSTDE